MSDSRLLRCPVCGKRGVRASHVVLKDEGDEFASSLKCQECGAALRGNRSWKLKKTMWVWVLLAIVCLPSLPDFDKFYLWQGVAAISIVVGHFIISFRPPLERDDRTD